MRNLLLLLGVIVFFAGVASYAYMAGYHTVAAAIVKKLYSAISYGLEELRHATLSI